MQICLDHWQMIRDAIEHRGMTGLVAKSGEEVVSNLIKEASGQTVSFDPLMSMNMYWGKKAMESGGLYLMTVDEDGNHYCPLCEFVKHCTGFEASKEIGLVADQMRDFAIQENLIKGIQ